MQLGIFIGDMCYLSKDGYYLYDSNGNTIMNEKLSYTSPMLVGGTNFNLCYDLGGTSFTILNTFSNLYSETLTYPINDATIADNGSFAIATSSREYRTTVLLYDSDFKLRSRIYKDKYLTDVKLKKDASELVIAGINAKDGDYYSEISLIETGSDKEKCILNLPVVVYSIDYTKDGFVIVSDKGIFFLDSNLKPVSKVTTELTMAMTRCSDAYFTAVYTDGAIGNSHIAVVYDTKGNKCIEEHIDGKLHDVEFDESGKYVFILTDDSIYRISIAENKIGHSSVENDGITVLVLNEHQFLLAKQSYAVNYDISNIGQLNAQKPENTAPQALEESDVISYSANQERN